MHKAVHKFLDWWKDAPFYFSMWFIPIVMVLWVFAVIKNKVTGEK